MGAEVFHFGGPDFGGIKYGSSRLDNDHLGNCWLAECRNYRDGPNSGVGGKMGGTGSGHFGRLLNRWRKSSERVVLEWIVVPAGRELGRNSTGHQDDNGSHLRQMNSNFRIVK